MKHNERHPVSTAAEFFSVDRKTLGRWLERSGIDSEHGVTLSEAMRALNAKADHDAPIRRKNVAEAERAEARLAHFKATFVPRSLHEHTITNFREQTQAVVEGASFLPPAARKRLARELAAIEPMRLTRKSQT